MTSSSRRPPRDTSHRLAVVTGKFPSVCENSDHRYPPQGHDVKKAKDDDLACLSLWWEGSIPWTLFMPEDSLFFIDGILHLRAELTIKQASTMSLQS
ncbi:hypothetical protein C4D60_Mb06t14700 [Musa balbisiana]|uniref:Uncharacterized protein n=1 Tax=Musa balbisiana TaxID=52838 RepID=A0A4S8IPB1_MUSBA|nr:hypothetical protein C4D60_Mb06t14700 [Musa balbisiana]